MSAGRAHANVTILPTLASAYNIKKYVSMLGSLMLYILVPILAFQISIIKIPNICNKCRKELLPFIQLNIKLFGVVSH